MFDHPDTLHKLNEPLPLSEKLRFVHAVLRERFEAIERVSVALYDPATDIVKTFIDSAETASPLQHYEARLAEARSLADIVEKGLPRVVNDLKIFAPSDREHTRRIAESGYGASYTMPMYIDNRFFGFLFFNSRRTEVFSNELLHHLDVFGHLIALAVINDLSAMQKLLATVKTAREIAHARDCETGAHLDRMARYARLIGRELAQSARHALSDEFIEHLFIFAPLHDIGKIAIPDHILLKPGPLDADETAIMRTHTTLGREIIDRMLRNFELADMAYVDILRNITQSHHEAINGEGYPEGLRGEAIPIEARIVAVADVFDALTSQRPYKAAWSNDRAFATLQAAAGQTLDADCVNALAAQRAQVEAIQRRFREDRYA